MRSALIALVDVTPAMIRRAKARNRSVTADEMIRLKHEGVL